MMKSKPHISVLNIIANQRKLGTLLYENDKLSFQYSQSWQELEQAFVISVSMPVSEEMYNHDVIEPYLWGLLPDNNAVLAQYGKQFQVSPRRSRMRRMIKSR